MTRKTFGWHVYGKGTVTANGRQIQPDPGVYLYEFTGAMIGFARNPPSEGPLGTPDGDPVDLATGLFVMEKTDLFLPDVLPLALTRTYRQNDNAVRPFGIGTTDGSPIQEMPPPETFEVDSY